MSRHYCPHCGADWSFFAEDPDSDVLGFKLRGMNTCCGEQMREWVIDSSRLSTRNKIRVLKELGLT